MKHGDLTGTTPLTSVGLASRDSTNPNAIVNMICHGLVRCDLGDQKHGYAANVNGTLAFKHNNTSQEMAHMGQE